MKLKLKPGEVYHIPKRSLYHIPGDPRGDRKPCDGSVLIMAHITLNDDKIHWILVVTSIGIGWIGYAPLNPYDNKYKLLTEIM